MTSGFNATQISVIDFAKPRFVQTDISFLATAKIIRLISYILVVGNGGERKQREKKWRDTGNESERGKKWNN